MHLASMSWNDLLDQNTLANLGPMGDDVHLLRGGNASLDLRKFLVLSFVTDPGDPPGSKDQLILASDLATKPALANLLVGQKITFSATFTIRPEHAISINPDTGVVTATVPSASDIAAAGGQINNFLLQAVGTNVSGGSPKKAFIRFHLHGQLDSTHATLSPTGLTLRVTVTAANPKPTNRFTVLAQFDDGVVGDVSLTPGLTWTLLQKDSTGNFVAVPSRQISENGNVALTMTSDGFLTIDQEFTSDVFVRCSISLSTGVSVDTPPAQVFFGGEWPDNTLPVHFIDGDGVNNVDKVPNVLIVSEGFRQEDKGAFEELVDRLVADIRKSRNSEPYRSFLTNRAMNFFSTFIPSREFGCSVLYELGPALSGILYGPVFNVATPPPLGVTQIDALTYVVGLPIPADANLSVDDAITRWGKLYGDTFTTTVSVGVLKQNNNQLYKKWTTLAGRTLAVERDTALGVVIGRRPNVSSGPLQGDVLFNRFRAKPQDLRARLRTVAAVTDGVGTQLPALWKTPEASDSGATSKDTPLVIILCAGLPNAGTTSLDAQMGGVGIGAIARPVLVQDFTPAPPAPQDSWKIVALDPPAAEVSPALLGTFLHELSHGIASGDEYAGSSSPPGSNELQQTQLFGNIVLDTTVRNSSPNQNDPFDMKKALWGAAPRIRAAGVLAKNPKQEGSQYRITLLPKHVDGLKALGLKTGDPLFLRARPLMQAIATLTVPPQPQQPPDFTKGISPVLSFQKFDSSAGSDDDLLVTVAGGATLGAAFNAPGPVLHYSPILFAPTLAKDGKTPLPLISPVISAYLSQAGSVPMSRAAGVACVPGSNADDPEDSKNAMPTVQKVRTMPDAIVKAVGVNFLSMIVGLFDGGAATDCGVFHPTGYCAMRASSQFVVARPDPYPRVFRAGGMSVFCHVCRYLLIDTVEPRLHGVFDGLYNRLYVESAP
jgi:hypothetical protein